MRILDTNTGETIIGFAGTNQSNGWEQTGNDFIADGIGLGISGISPNSRYMQKANDFINNLKKDGYNITQATGHSLGGALCVLAGLNHDIPLIITSLSLLIISTYRGLICCVFLKSFYFTSQ